MAERQPMSPVEFDEACRKLCTLCPNLSESSGKRSVVHNNIVGGHPNSKHLLGMARDFSAGNEEELIEASLLAEVLGLWYVVHTKNSGIHLHVQGLPTGPIPQWWELKYVQRTEREGETIERG